ncbi:hypothetical protein D8S78_22410 [Natrialba swarupiae]|nr:hypothetical protein [Natrialba swarupiae]
MVLFIDEIDSVLRARSSVNQHNEDRKAVNEFSTTWRVPESGDLVYRCHERVRSDRSRCAQSIRRDDPNRQAGCPDAKGDVRGPTSRTTTHDLRIRNRNAGIWDEGFTARDIKKVVTNAARDTLIDDESSTISYEFLRRSVIEYGASSEDG